MTEIRLGDKRIPFIYQGDTLISPAPVKDGLVLWYDFAGMRNSDMTKGVAVDLSGNGNDGSLENFNYTDESGYIGDGLKFDGVDDYTTAESARNWVDTGKVTAEVVFSTNSEDKQYFILGKHYTNFDMALRRGVLNIWYSDGTTGNYVSDVFYDTLLSDGFLHHLVVIYHKDISGSEVYVDGVKYGENFRSDATDLSGFSDRPFELGHRVGGRDPFIGNIYSTRIYNHPLSPEEIQHNYQIEKARHGL